MSQGMEKKLCSVNINGRALPHRLSSDSDSDGGYSAGHARALLSSALTKHKLLFYANDRNLNIKSPPSDLLSAAEEPCATVFEATADCGGGRLWFFCIHSLPTQVKQTEGDRVPKSASNCSLLYLLRAA